MQAERDSRPNECEDDQTDETYSVASYDSSPERRRGGFSASFAQENTAAYWTFVPCLELTGFVDTVPLWARTAVPEVYALQGKATGIGRRSTRQRCGPTSEWRERIRRGGPGRKE